jgi:hypothetical protein
MQLPDLPAWVDSLGSGVIAGALGGVLATIAWERWLKPRRVRHLVAKVLEKEISVNLELIGSELASLTTAKSVSEDFRLSVTIFEAFREQLGELPHESLGEVVMLYRRFEHTQLVHGQVLEKIDKRNAVPIGAETRARFDREIDRAMAVLDGAFRASINSANAVQPTLWKLAHSWIRRFLKLERMRQEDMRDVAARVREHMRTLPPQP